MGLILAASVVFVSSKSFAERVRLSRPISAQDTRAVEAYGLPSGPLRHLPEELYAVAARKAMTSLLIATSRGLELYPRGVGLNLSDRDLATLVLTELRRQTPNGVGDVRGDIREFESFALRDDSYIGLARNVASDFITTFARAQEDPDITIDESEAIDEAMRILFLIRYQLVMGRWMIERLEIRRGRDIESGARSAEYWDPIVAAGYSMFRRQLIAIDWLIKRLAFRDSEKADVLASAVFDVLMAFNVSQERSHEILSRAFEGTQNSFALNWLASRFFERASQWTYSEGVGWVSKAGVAGLMVAAGYAGFAHDSVATSAFWALHFGEWTRAWSDRHLPLGSWAASFGSALDRMASFLANRRGWRGERRGPLTTAFETRFEPRDPVACSAFFGGED